MPFDSGTPLQRNYVGAEGVVMGGARDYNVQDSNFREEIEVRTITNTSDYNPATNTVNPRELVVSSRITGTITVAVDGLNDIRRDLPPGSIVPMFLCIDRAAPADGGPPATRYFDLPQALIRGYNHSGRGAQDIQTREVEFSSQGIYNYVSPAPAS